MKDKETDNFKTSPIQHFVGFSHSKGWKTTTLPASGMISEAGFNKVEQFIDSITGGKRRSEPKSPPSDAKYRTK